MTGDKTLGKARGLNSIADPKAFKGSNGRNRLGVPAPPPAPVPAPRPEPRRARPPAPDESPAETLAPDPLDEVDPAPAEQVDDAETLASVAVGAPTPLDAAVASSPPAAHLAPPAPAPAAPPVAQPGAGAGGSGPRPAGAEPGSRGCRRPAPGRPGPASAEGPPPDDGRASRPPPLRRLPRRTRPQFRSRPSTARRGPPWRPP